MYSEFSVMVEYNVNALLNQLTVENFDSVSDKIISWTNKSEDEKDARTLFWITKLVFERSMEEATSEAGARLCKKMTEHISPKIQNDGFRDPEGKPIPGGQLFRKFLLNRCQENFEREWVAKDEALQVSGELKGEQANSMDATPTQLEQAKRHRLRVIRFIGELFKVGVVTERVVHKCVQKLLSNVDNEGDIEIVCELFTAVGSILDTQKAKAHMDVYFSRMIEITRKPSLAPRLQLMLQVSSLFCECSWLTNHVQGCH